MTLNVPETLTGLQPYLFLSKIEIDEESDCWLWTGALGGSGFYGTYAWRYIDGDLNPCKNQMPAHRIMYMLYVGPIPTGLQLDHLCRIHKCVNPNHLEIVTPKMNQNRGLNGELKTHCARGHIFAGDNIYQDSRGFRECRQCRYDAVIRFRNKGVM